MHRTKAEIFREYGPFPGADNVHGVAYDGHSVWFASGGKMNAFDPASGVEHVHARERLFAEAQDYFVARGKVVGREARGSQDGEYVTVSAVDNGEPSNLAFLIDLVAVHVRAQCDTFEEFLRRYPGDLA